MIYENDMDDRAGQPPEVQFRYIEQLAAKRRTSDRDYEGNLLWDDFDYMIHVLPAAEAFNISDLIGWKLPDRSDLHCMQECRNFRDEATRVSIRILYRNASLPEKDPTTVSLNVETKTKLRFHLQQIHTLIDNEQLPEWLKQELHGAVSALEREFDKARTSLSTVLEVLGQIWDGSKSVGDSMRVVVGIVLEAKKTERGMTIIASPVQQKQLSAPERVKQLKQPTNKKVNGSDNGFGDKNPF